MTSSGRPARSPDELLYSGNHLLYEMQMLSNTAALLENWPPDDQGWKSKTQYMSALESFLIHARSAIDFLCPAQGYETHPRKADDIIAADYCTSGPWVVEHYESFRRIYNVISRDIVHLTYNRPDIARNWPYEALRAMITGQLSRFLDVADRLDAHFVTQLRAVVNGSRVSTGLMPPVVPDTVPATEISGLITGNSVATTTFIQRS
jgi:hypothetical protein